MNRQRMPDLGLRSQSHERHNMTTEAQTDTTRTPGGFLKFMAYVVALPLSLLAMVAFAEAWRYVVVFYLLVILDVAFMCLTALHDIRCSSKR